MLVVGAGGRGVSCVVCGGAVVHLSLAECDNSKLGALNC